MDYEKIKEAAATSTLMKKVLSYKDLKRCREAHEVTSILKRKNFIYQLEHLGKETLSLFSSFTFRVGAINSRDSLCERKPSC